MSYFQNKTIWITGASSGIGESLAYEFANQGANLILSARNTTELERVKSNCRADSKVLVHRLDLSDFNSMKEIVGKVKEEAGNIDILINNAGISQRAKAKDTAFEVDQRMININLLGTIALSKALLPHFLEKKSGHYVVVTSLMGKFASPLRSSYAAAKHGLHGFFDALRAEVHDDNVKVTLVCPGFVRTNISINALTGDGAQQGTMDDATDKGLSPEELAKKMAKAIKNGREEIYIGGWEIMGIYMKRFFPKILSRFIRKAKVT